MTRLTDRLTSGVRSFFATAPMAQQTPLFLFGGTETPWAPNDDPSTYLGISNAVAVCVKRRAQALASLPLVPYRGTGSNRKDVTAGPLVELLDRVNPFWTFSRLIEMTEMSLGVWGEAFWFLDRGQQHRMVPKEIWWARSDRVRVIPSANDYISHFEYTPPGATEPQRYERDEVIWFHYPNPSDEFEGLSPLMAAALAADTGRYAQVSNVAMFKNGMNLGGIITPQGEFKPSPEQAKEVEQTLHKRFAGADKAHRWAVFRFDAKVQPLGISQKDAEYLGGLNWSLEEIARAYGIPLDLIGGQRTYANVQEARLAFWMDTLQPEARFLAGELTEQLLPMFPGQGDELAFDTSNVPALQEAKAAEWDRWQSQIDAGAVLINEYRSTIGADPLPHGDYWWTQATKVPIGKDTVKILIEEVTAPPEPPPAIADSPPPAIPAETPPATKSALPATIRAIAYGSPEHEQLWRAVVRRTEPHEAAWGTMTAKLMRDQRQAVMARLKGRAARDVADVASDPFDKGPWIKKFREASRPLLDVIIGDAGAAAMADIGIGLAFDLHDPNVIRFLEGRAQRFAREVNETTWEQLKASLSEGVQAGESIPELADRVETVMGERIRSSGETIARTEVIGASNGGTVEGYKQSGVVSGKEWIAALDERTRETHVEAHGQRVGLDEDFDVGDGSGPAPGQIGLPEEDINCFPGDAVVYAESLQAVTRRWYSGNVVDLTLGSGRVITVTPNHPLLGVAGWQAAGDINEGDDLIGYRNVENASFANPYPYHGPVEIAKIFRSASMAFQSKRVPGRGPQFHGDGLDGDVEVVWTHGQLLGYNQRPITEPIGKQLLTAADIDAADLLGSGAPFQFAHAPARATNSVVGIGRKTLSLLGSRLGHAQVHRFASVALDDARIVETANDGGAGNSELLGKRLYRRPGVVTLDKVVRVNVRPFSGHVFNLHTDTNHYVSNGIISRNCRCSVIPVLDTDPNQP